MSNVVSLYEKPETNPAQAQAALVAVENAVHALLCMPPCDVARLIYLPHGAEAPPVWRIDQLRAALMECRSEVQVEAERLFRS